MKKLCFVLWHFRIHFSCKFKSCFFQETLTPLEKVDWGGCLGTLLCVAVAVNAIQMLIAKLWSGLLLLLRICTRDYFCKAFVFLPQTEKTLKKKQHFFLEQGFCFVRWKKTFFVGWLELKLFAVAHFFFLELFLVGNLGRETGDSFFACVSNEHWGMRLLWDHHTFQQKQRPRRWSVQTVWRRSVFSSGRVELIHRCGEVDSTREVSVHVTFLLFLFLYSQNTTFLVRDERRVTIGGKNCGRFLRLEWLSTKVCLLCLSVSQSSKKVVFQVWSHTQQTVVVSFKTHT